MSEYARGSRAWGICGKCGLRGYLNQMVFDGHTRNMRVHVGCYEPRHPSENLPALKDPIALWRPAPESFNPPTTPVLSGEVIATFYLLQENGDRILLEGSTDALLIES